MCVFGCRETEGEKERALQTMNLTAVTEASEVMERHVEDSLAIAGPIRSSYLGASCDGLSVVDVGSGAGLPGLILAIACPGNLGDSVVSNLKFMAFLS